MGVGMKRRRGIDVFGNVVMIMEEEGSDCGI